MQGAGHSGAMSPPELETYEKKLREVFDPVQAQFSAIVARLSVLFEDLRIEEYGSRLDTLNELHPVSHALRAAAIRSSIRCRRNPSIAPLR